MADTIVLTIPTAHGFRAVVSLVLGGVGTRFDLPYEQMDDLQLAVLSVLESASDESVTLEVEPEDESLCVSIGPLLDGVGSDQALGNVLERLVDRADEAHRDGDAWLRLRLDRPSPA